jgi:hypothetical protein
MWESLISFISRLYAELSHSLLELSLMQVSMYQREAIQTEHPQGGSVTSRKFHEIFYGSVHRLLLISRQSALEDKIHYKMAVPSSVQDVETISPIPEDVLWLSESVNHGSTWRVLQQSEFGEIFSFFIFFFNPWPTTLRSREVRVLYRESTQHSALLRCVSSHTVSCENRLLVNQYCVESPLF